jgi:hypothetical protein
MKDLISVYAGAFLLVAWGIAHIVPTPSVIRDLGPISAENKRIVVMEWAVEGLTLCFIGSLAAPWPGRRASMIPQRSSPCASAER